MEIVYENEKFLVINKPAGLLSLPGRGSLLSEKNLYSILKEKYGSIFVVHRLDKETSGLIVFAKDSDTHKKLSEIMEKREIEKKYLALVFGSVSEKTGEINKRLKEFSSGRVAVDFNGKDSITKYTVLERYEKYTLLEVSLLTGRRHQIRVHLYSIGHPIVGDDLYGESINRKKYPRLMLHSYKLSFNIYGKDYSFKCSPDEFFYEIIKDLT